jgi:AraC-like DNA-binding protein
LGNLAVATIASEYGQCRAPPAGYDRCSFMWEEFRGLADAERPQPAEKPAYAPARTALHRANGLQVARHRCCAGPRHRPFEEQHQAFSISYVEYGVFAYRSARGDAELAPGWLLLGNDGEDYVCSHEHNDGRGDSCIVLSVSAEVLESVRRVLGRPTGTMISDRPTLPPVPRVSALFAALAVAGNEGFAREEASLAAVAAVLSEAEGRDDRARVRDERAYAAARFIERRARDPLSLDEVAAEVGLGAFHFVRVFRAAIGITPHQYLMRIRLQRAMALLQETHMAVIEVAYESGWNDLSTFNRTFRRDVGCTPREYRNGRTMIGAPRRHASA